MVPLPCALLAVLCAGPQDAPAEPPRSVAQELADLIAKTNALESLHLVYDAESSEGKQGSLELVYRAPDLGRVRSHGSFGEGDHWVVGAHVYRLQDGAWTQATVPGPAAASLALDHLFPGDAKPLVAGVTLGLGLYRDEPERPGNVALGFTPHPEGRESVLGWLQALQTWPDVSAAGSVLRRQDEGMLCEFARASGLLQRVELTSEKGTFRLVLREAHVDEPLDDELVTPPSEARAAPEDPELTRTLAPNLGRLRWEAFLRVEQQLAAEKRPWNDAARADWRAVLEALHRQAIDEWYAKRLATLRGNIEELAARHREANAAGASAERRTQLEQQVTQLRAFMEKGLASDEALYLESLHAVDSDELHPRAELGTIEHEVVGDVWDEMVQKPLFAAFDEATGKAKSSER